jgi:hypothetical protein
MSPKASQQAPPSKPPKQQPTSSSGPKTHRYDSGYSFKNPLHKITITKNTIYHKSLRQQHSPQQNNQIFIQSKIQAQQTSILLLSRKKIFFPNTKISRK